MHDGAIVYDEKSPIGQIPKQARQIMFSAPKKTEEDDLAGVSALMKAIPSKIAKKPAKPKTAPAKAKKKRKKRGTR
jgi:hypothetical protein